MESDPKEVGRKVAFYRQRRGLSQREFAPLIGRSEAWLSQVERGVRVVDRVSVLERIAEVLEIPVAELAPDSATAAVADESGPALSLRLLLSEAYALPALLSARTARVPGGLKARTDKAWELARESRLAEMAELLCDLLPELETACRTTTGDRQSDLFALLARAYHACNSALTKLGQLDAAWVATDRAIAAAERSGDPLLVAAGAFRLTLTFLNARQFRQAVHAASTAIDALAPRAAKGDPAALSLYGALNLQWAMAAARTNDASAVEEHLALARDAAGRLGADRDDYETEFGPTNVALHEVAAAVELGDAGRALRIAETVDASHLSKERQSRLLVDVARAWAQRRRVPEALDALLRAEQLTPEQFRTSSLVDASVKDLLRMASDPPDALVRLGKRITLS